MGCEVQYHSSETANSRGHPETNTQKKSKCDSAIRTFKSAKRKDRHDFGSVKLRVCLNAAGERGNYEFLSFRAS